MPEEGRYIQQRYILIDEDAGEGVAKIVEPNLAQTVLLDQVGEPLRDPIRAYQPAELIDADIIVVFAVVAALEHTAVQVLLFPFLAQHFLHRVRQRQCAAAGFVFHFLYFRYSYLPPKSSKVHLLLSSNRVYNMTFFVDNNLENYVFQTRVEN